MDQCSFFSFFTANLDLTAHYVELAQLIELYCVCIYSLNLNPLASVKIVHVILS